MAENLRAEETSVGGRPLTRTTIAELLSKNFGKLPDTEQKFFLYGPLYLGGNAALAGLVTNSLYRRALHVTQASVASGLPMTVMPFITVVAMYNASVCAPLMSGDLNCASCAMTRGALVGLVGAGLYPVALALPVNLSLASRYLTTPLPEKGSRLRFSWELSRPILLKMRPVLLLQVFFGMYLGSRHFKVYTKLADMTFGSGGEEL